MIRSSILGRVQRLRIVALALVVVLAYGFLSYARLEATNNVETTTIDLPGVAGTDNTVAFAFDRFALIAPYASSKPVEENGDPSQLNNHFVDLIDLKKPGTTLSKDLTRASVPSVPPLTLYYPRKVVFDPISSNVFVQGITFDSDGEGGLESHDAIASFHLNLDGGKPVLDGSVVIIPIRDIPGAQIDSQVDFAVSKDGRLVFTNGVTIFTYSIEEGYIYQFDMFPPEQYGPDTRVTLLQLDQSSSLLSVCWNKKEKGEDGTTHEVSELSAYSLNGNGTLDLIKRTRATDFPNGSFLTRGSNVVVVSDADGAKQTMFVTSDGSLCQVSLREGNWVGEVKQLAVFDDLAQTGDVEPSARILQYDPARRILSIVRQGFTAQIARPTNGKRGHIARPTNSVLDVERPLVTLAKFGKKDRISSIGFSSEFAGETGLSNMTARSDSEWLVASYSGKLYSLMVQDDIATSTLVTAGELGSRVERIDYQATRESVVAVNSLITNDTGSSITKPGSVVVGRFVDHTNSARFIQSFLPTSVLAKSNTSSIRRPCNSRR